VSSTRLQAVGIDAPTPTTVVSAAELEAQAKPSIFDASTQLPACRAQRVSATIPARRAPALIGLFAWDCAACLHCAL